MEYDSMFNLICPAVVRFVLYWKTWHLIFELQKIIKFDVGDT